MTTYDFNCTVAIDYGGLYHSLVSAVLMPHLVKRGQRAGWLHAFQSSSTSQLRANSMQLASYSADRAVPLHAAAPPCMPDRGRLHFCVNQWTSDQHVSNYKYHFRSRSFTFKPRWHADLLSTHLHPPDTNIMLKNVSITFSSIKFVLNDAGASTRGQTPPSLSLRVLPPCPTMSQQASDPACPPGYGYSHLGTQNAKSRVRPGSPCYLPTVQACAPST